MNFTLQKKAEEQVKKFRAHPAGHKCWKYFDRKHLADGLDFRINDPDGINQGKYGTCGPTVIVRDIIEDDPVEYVNLTTALFWTGRCKIHHGRHGWPYPLMASYDLRHYKPHHSVNAADWILTATLRDNINDNFCRAKFRGNDDIHGSHFDKQAQMLRGLGYRHVHWHGASSVPASREVMLQAKHYKKHGYHVQLSIDATLIQRGKQDNPRGGEFGYHNHWVEMLTPFEFAGGGANETISCRLFSWGNPYDLPLDYRIPLKVSKFHEKFFGYVAAKY